MNEFTRVGLELVDANSKDVDDKWAKYCREVLGRYTTLGPAKFSRIYQVHAEQIQRKLDDFIPGTVMPSTYPAKPYGWSLNNKGPYEANERGLDPPLILTALPGKIWAAWFIGA